MLAQTFVGDKTNEITAIPELLAMLELKGMVVTLDAMGTQRAIAADIVEREGDYILAVKGNQGRLHDEVADQFDFALRQLATDKLDPARWSAARTQESGHDRTETRSVLVCHDLSWMSPDIRADWQGVASIVMVHRHTLLGGGKIRSETSYHISSLKGTRAAVMLGYIRGHWGIENRCHWVLDAICREDHNQTRDRNAAANHATMRRMALNAHNRMPYEGKRPKSLPRKTPLPNVGTLKCWCIPSKANASFVARMEEVLEAYQRPYGTNRLLVCLDEFSKPLLGEASPPLPTRPGRGPGRTASRSGTEAFDRLLFLPG